MQTHCYNLNPGKEMRCTRGREIIPMRIYVDRERDRERESERERERDRERDRERE